MTDFLRKKGGSKPSADYIRLGSILQKERSPARQSCVNAILKSKASLKSIIDKIVLVDQTDERQLARMFGQGGAITTPGKTQGRGGPATHGVWEYSGPGHEKQKTNSAPALPSRITSESLPDDAQEELYLTRKNQSKIKKNLQRSSSLRFFFHEYSKIRSFGIRSGTLYAAFPFRLRINSRIFENGWMKGIQNAAVAIVTVLDPLQPRAWLYVSKFEYNSLALILEFCRTLLRVAWFDRERDDRLFIHRLRDVERFLLVLYGDRDISEAVFSALEKIAEHDKRHAGVYETTAATIKALVFGGHFYPSLHNLILACNMIAAGRFLDFSDLINTRVGALVAGSAYDCPDDVIDDIRSFVVEQKDKLYRLARERDILRAEHALLPMNRRGEIDYGPLSAFYNAQAQPVKGGAFPHDADQALFFLVKFTDFFIKSFKPLLCGTLIFDAPDSGVLFCEEFLSPEMERFSLSLKRLERHTFTYGSLTRSRYLDIRRKHQVATRIEGEAMSLTNEILGGLRVISQKVSTALKPVVAGKPAVGNTAAFAQKIIRNSGVLAGKTVFEALSYAISIAYGAGLFMADPSLYQMMDREIPVHKEIESILREIKRVGSEREFVVLGKRYVE